MTARGALFLDRDGTIITDEHYLNDPQRVRLIDGALAALCRAIAAEVPIVIVTNQSGIARGFISQEQYDAVAARLNALLMDGGVQVLATYYAPEAPGSDDENSNRKPGLGMYRRAATEHGIDLRRSAYIGDKWRDVQPALSVGGFGVLVPNASTEQADIDRATSSAQIADSLQIAIDRALVWMRAGD